MVKTTTEPAKAAKPKPKPEHPPQRYVYLLRNPQATVVMASTAERDVGEYVYAKVPENQRRAWDVVRVVDGGELKSARVIGTGFEVMTKARGK